MKLDDLAKEMGVHITTVRLHARKAGIEPSDDDTVSKSEANAIRGDHFVTGMFNFMGSVLRNDPIRVDQHAKPRARLIKKGQVPPAHIIPGGRPESKRRKF
jgi:hypothetical protein